MRIVDKITLEELIRQYVALPTRHSHGWQSVLCKVCNDHGNKGKRGGFKFEGETVGYNCFNCGHTAIFDPAENTSIPDKMVTVLNAFGIPEQEWQQINLQQLGKNVTLSHKTTQKIAVEPPEIKLPSYCYPVCNDSNEWNQVAIEYLKDRGVPFDAHPFYNVKLTNHPDSKRWYGRLVIPAYKDKKVVFYQGRDMSDTRESKYLSPDVPKGSVLSNYDFVTEKNTAPLYITEGWFNAYHIKGVAVFGRKLSDIQIAWLNKTNRDKVIVPDKTGDGADLARQALNIGWNVSLPDIGSCEDVNEAVQRYGQLYVQKTIFDNTCAGFEAEARLGIYCTNEKR